MPIASDGRHGGKSANSARRQVFALYDEYAVACEALRSDNAVWACPTD
jgi:hypothetical protein